MRKYSSIKKALPIALALTAAPAITVCAQEIKDSFYNRTADFMLVSQYMHELPRSEKTQVESILKGKNATKIYAVDPVIGLNSRLKFLNSDRAKKFYSEEQRKLLMGRYQNFLSEISKEKRSSDYGKSLASLTGAVKDSIINPEELKNVEDGIYMIVKEGKENECNNPYSVFALVRLSKGGKLEEKISLPISKAEKEKVYGLPLPEVEEVPEVSLQPLIFASEGEKLYTPKAPKVPRKKKTKEYKEGKEPYFSLIAQGTANSDFDAYSGSLGTRYNFNKHLGLGLNLDVGFGLDNLVDSYSGPLSCGKVAIGSVTDTNKFSIGGSLETQLGPVLLGAGFDYKTWMTKTVEQIIMEGCENVLKSNTNTTPNRQVFGKVYGGLEAPIGKNWKLGAILGYNWKDGAYFGLRTAVKLNNREK